LQDFTGFYRILQDLRDVAGFYRVLRDFSAYSIDLSNENASHKLKKDFDEFSDYC